MDGIQSTTGATQDPLSSRPLEANASDPSEGRPYTEHIANATLEEVALVERRLLEHPDYGQSARIEQRALSRYEFALEICAERRPNVERLLALLRRDETRFRRALGDPAVRCVLEETIQQLESGVELVFDPLEQALECCVLPGLHGGTTGPSELDLSARLRVGREKRIWLWSIAERPGFLGQKLLEMFDWEFTRTDASAVMCTPDASTVTRLDAGMCLLETLLPTMSRSATRHISSIAIARTKALISSSGGDHTPSTFFLTDQEWARDPWTTAEATLHEGLHLKLFDVIRTRSLIAKSGAVLRVPWRSIEWPLIRVIFSFHVYVHLILFYEAVRLSRDALAPSFGEPPATTVSVAPRALARARYLGSALTTTFAGHLSLHGERLIRWLVDAVKPLGVRIL